MIVVFLLSLGNKEKVQVKTLKPNKACSTLGIKNISTLNDQQTIYLHLLKVIGAGYVIFLLIFVF